MTLPTDDNKHFAAQMLLQLLQFSLNKVFLSLMHQKSLWAESVLQPLQSVCQPSFIQLEIFLSVGSLLSWNGTPPRREGLFMRCLLGWHPALSSITVWIYSRKFTGYRGWCERLAFVRRSLLILCIFRAVWWMCRFHIAFNQSSNSTLFRFIFKYLKKNPHTSSLTSHVCYCRTSLSMNTIL